MQAPALLGALVSDVQWTTLASDLRIFDESDLLESLFKTFRAAGAKGFVYEKSYIDRDFSAAYSAFYSTLFRPYLKYCSRLHFFDTDLSSIAEIDAAEDLSRAVEDKASAYLGYVVIRPVTHAPIGAAVIAADRLAQDSSVKIDVRANYPVHLLGADLDVVGFPLTQQDTRVGACAQAAIWMAGRHFHRSHGGPWLSMPAINEAALKPTDIQTSRSLPAGSEFLAPDNIVRALRAMDRHPVVQGPTADPVTGMLKWAKPPQEALSAYLDSGIPVLIGLRGRNGGVGHAVVAVGRVMVATDAAALNASPSTATLISHFLVNDDQRGTHQRLPIAASDRTGDYPWTLEEDALWVMVPLPSKVFMRADIAEKLSRDALEGLVARVDEYRQRAIDLAPAGSPTFADVRTVDPAFFALATDKMVSRTYLTFGWKYKRRALRNRMPKEVKEELINKHFPRYVWVTEFSLPDDLDGLEPCRHHVRAHVVLDATGSKFYGESNLIIQITGLSVFWTFDPDNPRATRGLVWRVTDAAEPFYPKVRGWPDFDRCPPNPVS